MTWAVSKQVIQIHPCHLKRYKNIWFVTFAILKINIIEMIKQLRISIFWYTIELFRYFIIVAIVITGGKVFAQKIPNIFHGPMTGNWQSVSLSMMHAFHRLIKEFPYSTNTV